jgi:uncharacterized damage-inducible protein DinB
MKSKLITVCLCMFFAAGALAARITRHSETAQGAQQAPPSTVAATVDREISGIEKEFVDAAEAMPEDKYNFAPTQGEFKGERTFGDQIKHAAMANYSIWSTALEEKVPDNLSGKDAGASIKTKAQIVQLLKDSFALGHRAAQNLTTANMLDQLPKDKPRGPRLFWATYAIGHNFDHYGQIVIYLRMCGIVPPASRH